MMMGVMVGVGRMMVIESAVMIMRMIVIMVVMTMVAVMVAMFARMGRAPIFVAH